MMEILKRIKEYLVNSDGKSLWDYGFNCQQGSKASLRAWMILTEEEKLAISVFNPFKISRNKVIKKLHRQGLNTHILHQLSGLS